MPVTHTASATAPPPARTNAKTRRKKKTQRTGRESLEDMGLDHLERVALVCKYFCEGKQPGQIQKILKRDHRITISREAPYRYLAYAASKGWIQFMAPLEHSARQDLMTRYTYLDGVEVVRTAVYEDVADRAARMLLDLLRARTRPPYKSSEVHIGFAGGHVMRRVARTFAELLRGSPEGMPDSIVFHALVAGFKVDDPTTAPNSFFTYLSGDPSIRVSTRLVGLSAPSVVETTQLREFRKLDGIGEAATRIKELDIIVSSVGSFSKRCDHSLLLEYMRKSEPSLRALQAAGYIGDMLWLPLSPDGPITARTKIRAMTLIELSDLPRLIGAGKSVLLVVGPCRRCHEPRPEVLGAILGHKEQLVTHLVADTRSVDELLHRSRSRR